MTGKVDTSFIDENPDLTQKLIPGQNRAQKLLYYFANLMVNGPATPLATGLMPANVKPVIPPVTCKIYHLHSPSSLGILILKLLKDYFSSPGHYYCLNCVRVM